MSHPVQAGNAKLAIGVALLVSCFPTYYIAALLPVGPFTTILVGVEMIAGVVLVFGWIVARLERGRPARGRFWSVVLHPWSSGRALAAVPEPVLRRAPSIAFLTKLRSALAIVFVYIGLPLYLINSGVTGSMLDVAQAEGNLLVSALVIRPFIVAFLAIGSVYILSALYALSQRDNRHFAWRLLRPNREVAATVALRIGFGVVIPLIAALGLAVAVLGTNPDADRLTGVQRAITFPAGIVILWCVFWGIPLMLSHTYYSLDSSFRAHQTWPFMAPALNVCLAIVGIVLDNGLSLFVRAGADATVVGHLGLLSTVVGAGSVLLIAAFEALVIWRTSRPAKPERPLAVTDPV